MYQLGYNIMYVGITWLSVQVNLVQIVVPQP